MKPKLNRKPGKMDNCQTPGYALAPLLPFLESYAPELIWESACGEGYLQRALLAAGFMTCGTDIEPIEQGETPLDFLNDDYIRGVDILRTIQVTNPPFSRKFQWLKRSYELRIPFALLLPVETIGCKTAQDIWRDDPPEFIFMDRRVNFKMPNLAWAGKGAQFPVCWITHGLGIGRENTYAILPKVLQENPPISQASIESMNPKLISYNAYQEDRNV